MIESLVNKYSRYYKGNYEPETIRLLNGTSRHYPGTDSLMSKDTSAMYENGLLPDTSALAINKRNNVFESNSIFPCQLTNIKNKCFSLPFQLETLNISYSDRLLCIIPVVCGSNNCLKSLNVSDQRYHEHLKELWNVMKNTAIWRNWI